MAKKPARPRRLKQTPLLFYSACFGLLIVALVLAHQLRSEPQTQAVAKPVVVEQPDFRRYPVPTRPVAEGERLADVPMMLVSWPSTNLVGDYAQTLEELKPFVASVPLPEGLPVPKSSLVAPEELGNAVVDRIPEGMRAISVRVDAESAVEGWARPGNYVDVILIRPEKDAALGLETKVIAENVKVLSAGSSATVGPQGVGMPKPPATITLLTSQEDALKIKTASHVGKLAFSLRGQGDAAPVLATSMSQRKLLGDATAKPKTSAFKGVAEGPDGRVYVLDGERQWTATGEQSFQRRIRTTDIQANERKE